jgi:hypothetical protein
MKLYVLLRTRDEHRNIERFCRCYAFADKICVADGGSLDDTVALARQFPNVEVREFTQRVQGKNGLWRNPEGAHHDFLIDWAISEGADWMLHGDADCVPCKSLREKLPEYIRDADRLWHYSDGGARFTGVIQAYQIFIWGSDQYFPRLNEPGPGLYGWHRDSGLRFSEKDPWNVDLVNYDLVRGRTYVIPMPDVRLHYFCPDPEEAERKATFYRESGQQPSYRHPLQSCGPLKPIEPWMVVE